MYMRGTVIDEIVNAYEIEGTNQWTNYTFHHDNLQSVLGLSGHDGTILQTITYDAFGNQFTTTGAANNNELHYTGRELDPDTGLYNYRARLYDPTIGRFVSEDKMGFAAGVNFFVYAGNNPINANDPYGLATQITIGYSHTAFFGMTHGFVILTDTVTGQQYATRAGPQCFGCGGLGFGPITAVAASYNSDFKDKPFMTQEVGVIDRDYSDSVNNAVNFAHITNQNQIPYGFLGPNSNSYAPTFVQSLTGSRPVPPATVMVPGWDTEMWNTDKGQPSPAPNYSPAPLVNAAPNVSGASGFTTDTNNFAVNNENAANGGFLIYPNKPNTNMMQSVYSKR